MTENGLQDSGSAAEQPGLQTAELLEEHQDERQRKKWLPDDNKAVMECYLKADPSKRGYRQRMYQIWMEKFPQSMVTEQRLADQRNVITRRKFLTAVEIEEIQRSITSISIIKEMEEPQETVQQEPLREPCPQCTSATSAQSLNLSQRQIELRQKIMQNMLITNRCRLPILRHVATKKLAEVVKEANEVVSTIATESITKTNQLLYSTAYVVTEELGCKVSRKNQVAAAKDEPPWKRRLQCKIKTLRADVSSLEHLKANILQNRHTKKRLIQKYQLERKTVTEVAEELKQRIRATAEKVERYEARIEQFRQNRLFRTDQQRFYQQLNTGNQSSDEIPDKNKTTKFWSELWDNPVEHNKNAAWIQSVENELMGKEMAEVTITRELFSKQAKKLKNWSAPGKDEMHGYWIMHLTSLHQRMAQQLEEVLKAETAEN